MPPNLATGSFKLKNALLTIFLLTVGQASFAQTIAGADDPAFRLPFERLLQGDDPTALQEIHTAAENGNHAALRALPAVLNWVPPKGTLAERKRFRNILGVPLEKAVSAVSPMAAAWQSGKDIEGGPIDARVKQLARLGETLKAQHLSSIWLHAGYWDEIPLDGPAPPSLFLFSFLLLDRLQRGDDPANGLFLAQLLAKDKAEGWLTLARVLTSSDSKPMPKDFMTLEQIVNTSGVDVDVAGKKLTELNALQFWYHDWVGNRALDTALTAASILRGRPEFSPVEAFCKATCFSSAQACEAAWLFMSAPYEVPSDNRVPEVSLVPTKVFFATPRGADLIFKQIKMFQKEGVLDRHLQKAEKLDSCFVRAAKAHVAATGN